MLPKAIAVVLAASHLVNAVPFQQLPFSTPSPTEGNDDFNVLHHLSGISPFFSSHGESAEAPEGCVVISAAILARLVIVNDSGMSGCILILCDALCCLFVYYWSPIAGTRLSR